MSARTGGPALWRIVFDRRAEKELDAIGQLDRSRIIRALARLTVDTAGAANVKPLKGSEFFRLRVGDYRVLFSLDAGELSVLIVKVSHRREVYR